MDRLSLLLLWLAGWRWYKGKDGSGLEYIGFQRRHWFHADWRDRFSYFHVYHEGRRGETIRPRRAPRPTKKFSDEG